MMYFLRKFPRKKFGKRITHVDSDTADDSQQVKEVTRPPDGARD